jgi:hypothetical protein
LLNFFNGLVAPSFMFVSGLALAVASSRKLEDFHRFWPAFWHQLRRIGLIWILGYMLHLPGLAYSVLRAPGNAAAWARLARVDILHCIAAGLLTLLAIRVLITTEARFGRALWLGTFLVVLAAPWSWANARFERLPIAISGYFIEQGQTLFPLFPWLGFLMLGGACAITHSKADAADGKAGFMRRTAILGIILVVAGLGFARYGFPWPYGSSDVRANPVFFALRAGCLCLWVWICWQLQKLPAIPSSWIMTLSRESLLVYVSHIVVLYHVPISNASLARLYGKALTASECAGVACALTLLMWATALGWHWLKSHHQQRAQHLSYAAGAGATLLFLVR